MEANQGPRLVNKMITQVCGHTSGQLMVLVAQHMGQQILTSKATLVLRVYFSKSTLSLKD